MPKPITTNTLFYGDNLHMLRDYVADESVDLIYLDPPFNSSRTYNVLFKQESGAEAEAQIAAFEDTWHWNQAAERTFYDLVESGPPAVGQMIGALRDFVGGGRTGGNQMMAYLVMMAARLVELRRVLKPTGSIYLHCDPTASHYLKIVMDAIFGPQSFRNQINWVRSDAHSDVKTKWGSVTDHILFYTKSSDYVLNPQYRPYPERTLREWYLYLELPDGSVRKMTKQEIETQNIPDGARRFNTGDMSAPAGGGMAAINKATGKPNGWYIWKGYNPPVRGWRYSPETMQKLDEEGRLLYPSKKDGRIMLKRYLDEQKGVVVSDTWDDIQQIRAMSAEQLGYPTQKPVALLERIIQASSHPSDVVLDPFCGCGTTIHAAQKLGRRWIGIDITHLSIALLKYRLKDAFPDLTYDVIGEPEDLDGARALARDNRYQFQWWALSLVRAQPLGGETGARTGKKGADRGIDGVITFVDDAGGKVKRVIVQVKSGKVGSPAVRDLVGVLNREGAAIAVFVTLEEPTKEMATEAAAAGFYRSEQWGRDYPRLQLLTVRELLAGAAVQMPPTAQTFKQARREKDAGPQQGRLEL